MITKFKIYESLNQIIPQGKLDLSNRILINNIRDLDNTNYCRDSINEYLTRYYLRNENRKSYYDKFITDKQLNILFGESVDKEKFNYNLSFNQNTSPCHVFNDNKTKKNGLVDNTGKNIIVQPEYDFIQLSNGYWFMTTGKDNPNETAIASRGGKILMKKNNFFSSVSKQTKLINGEWIDVIQYKIKGDEKYRSMPIDEFFNTNWELKLATDKYNL